MSKEKQIESCENCLHYSACLINGEYVPTPCRAYEDKASYRKQSGWISVDERLPDQYEDVLGFCHYVYESGGVFDLILTMKLTTDGKFVPFNCSPLKEGIVTHWMPLPEPPKGD